MSKSSPPSPTRKHSIQSMRESMSSATHGHIGTCAKFTPKQKAVTLAILHVPSATLTNGLVIDSYSYSAWDTYAASDIVNVSAQNLATSCRICFQLTAASQAMTTCVVSYSVATYSYNIFSTPIAIAM